MTEVELVKNIFITQSVLESFLAECKLNICNFDEESIVFEEKGEFTKRADATFNYDGRKFIFECMSSKPYLDEDHIARAVLYCIRTNSTDLIILCEDVRDSVEKTILDNISNYNIKLSVIKYKLIDDMIVFTRVISPIEYSDQYKTEKSKYLIEDLTLLFAGCLPMKVSGTRRTETPDGPVDLSLKGQINVDGTIFVEETNKTYESLSAACMDGLKHVSGGLELKTSGWRFWRDDQGELLFKYKELHPAQNKTPD